MPCTNRQSILGDPLASESEIQSLDPMDALGHPNCPPDLWWEIAADYPLKAQASLLYPLLTLENPGWWGQMEHRHRDRWIDTWIMEQEKTLAQRFIDECRAHVQYPSKQLHELSVYVSVRHFAYNATAHATRFTHRDAAILHGRDDEWDAAWNEERCWQWQLVQEYHRGTPR